jgi:hypothetical protein
MKMSTLNFCDVEIGKNPLWNHILDETPDLANEIIRILDMRIVAMSFHEAVNLSRFVTRTNALPGDIAEVGTYFGGSAWIMARANVNQKKMHLFDTFTGIPEVTPGVDRVAQGDLKGGSLEFVQTVLQSFNHLIEYHVGMFPATAADISPSTKFSMVNLDMDVYQGTKSGLEYFYPKMVRGGMLVCHDYFAQSCPGVKKAVDEFFVDKPETIVDLWHSQIVVVKM